MKHSFLYPRRAAYVAPAGEFVLIDLQDLLCLSLTNEDISQIDPYDGWDS